MKKHLHNSLRALFLSLAVFLSLPLLAVEVEIDGINYELVSKVKLATVIVKSGGKYSGKVVIPESVEHEGTAYSVTSIGYEAFLGCSGLTSVTIPNSVKSIGNQAFLGCSGLTSVHISDIAAWCNIIFEQESGYVGTQNPLYYAHHLYLNGEEVKDLVIPNSVTSIRDCAFFGCSGLTSVTIPNSVTSIGDCAFYECSGLTSVTIGNSVTSIGGYAFSGCSGLTSVTIPNSVTSIGGSAFEGCSGLTSVSIGNSVTSIGGYAFASCSGLTSVTIGNSVKSIGQAAFIKCSRLTSVTIGNGVESIEYRAFSYCSELLDVYCYAERVPSTDNGAFYDSYPANATLHVPDASVNSYKATAPWSRFGKIVGIFTEIDGINYDFDAETKKATVIEKSSGKYSGEVVIPESVEYEGAAYSVTSIGEEAFYYCSGLTSVTIPNSVTSIGEEAFYYCSGLTSVTIPNSVTSIGNYAFYRCKGLTSVTIGNSVKSIGYNAFSGCSGLTSVSIGNSVESIGGYAFSDCSGLTSVTIPNSVTSIEDGAFYSCSGLTSVTIGNSVTSIGNGAFYSCSGLTSVTIGNSVTSIGYAAFYDCDGLTSVTIGNSVTSIGDMAFRGCSALTSLTIPNSVTSIGGSAFAGCSELLDVYCYAEKVPSTSNDAFNGSYPEYATLHVPDASIDSYKAEAPWSGFGNIVALTEEETGIDEVKSENANVKTALYDLSGRRVQKGQKGVFIQNGKVMVR